MTAMREARGDSASADPLNGTRGKANVNDRKFAFLNQITRPDYRSLPTSAATSQSSAPSTPVPIPHKTNGTEQIIFREFGAPIATPEDEEMLDDLEIKSEPLLSPRRTFTDFSESHSDEKENREEDTDADTTLREEIEDDQDMMMTSDVIDNEEKENFMEERKEEVDSEFVPTIAEASQQPEDPKDPIAPKPSQNLFVPPNDFIRMVESAPELTNPFRMSPEEEKKEAEEIRKMTESYGEPRKAVLQRVNLEETDDDETETETETENEEMEDDLDDLDDDVRRQIAAVSDIPMVFGWSGGGKKEKMEKPTSLPLHYEVEAAECSTPRRAEFSLNPEDEEPSSEDPTASTSSADEGVLQQSLLQLQKQLRKTDVRCSRLEKICEFQQRDIDSLRFEVDWKDKRIEYLQKTLQDMELSAQTTDASSTRSTSTS